MAGAGPGGRCSEEVDVVSGLAELVPEGEAWFAGEDSKVTSRSTCSSTEVEATPGEELDAEEGDEEGDEPGATTPEGASSTLASSPSFSPPLPPLSGLFDQNDAGSLATPPPSPVLSLAALMAQPTKDES